MKKIRDYYFKRAKEEKYLARSVYKLIEIDKKYRLLKEGLWILDIGCAPGSWTQYMLKKIGNGQITGIDVNKNVLIRDSRFSFINADIHDISADSLIKEKSGQPEGSERFFDLITSDAAPKTTGNKYFDSQQSLNIVKRVFQIAAQTLKPNGSVVAKIFQGEDVKDLTQILKKDYCSVSFFKPKSSRRESRELFIIALRSKVSK